MHVPSPRALNLGHPYMDSIYYQCHYNTQGCVLIIIFPFFRDLDSDSHYHHKEKDSGVYRDGDSYGFVDGSGPRSDSLLDAYIPPTTAAKCSWAYIGDLCPPHLPHTCLGSGTLSW